MHIEENIAYTFEKSISSLECIIFSFLSIEIGLSFEIGMIGIWRQIFNEKTLNFHVQISPTVPRLL